MNINAVMDAKKHEVELKVDQWRKYVAKDLKTKVTKVEKTEVEVKHTEEKVANQSKNWIRKWRNLEEKEKGLDSKLKSLNELHLAQGEAAEISIKNKLVQVLVKNPVFYE